MGENRAIVAIARILLERIFIMITGREKFIDSVDELTEKKIKSLEEKAREAREPDIQRTIKLIK